jgi:tripartite-type tricarboxylate transporter receptor subunit TctC
LPPAIVARLSAETVAGLQTPLVRSRLMEHAITPAPLDAAGFTAFVVRDVAQIGGMIRALGITAG